MPKNFSFELAHRLACFLCSFVYLLQASDVPIDDVNRRKKRSSHESSSDPSLKDVAVEIDHLFHYAVSWPTKSIRQYLEHPILTASSQSKASTTAREDVLKLLRIIIAPTLEVLYKIGSVVLNIVLEPTSVATTVLRTRHRLTRFRLALLHVLQYISDCHRYPYDYALACRAAQLMRVVDPSDAEAHMRLALNLSAQLDPVDVLVPFFHFCVFLYNRRVDPLSPEAAVVRRLVSSCSATSPSTTQRDCSARARFAHVFVPVVWDLLKNDGSSSEPVSKNRFESVSILLKKALDDCFTGNDGRYLIGILLNLLYAMRPTDTTQTKIHPSGAQSDQLVTQVLNVISEKVLNGLKNAMATARSRKKNCRRSRGKKRRGRGSVPVSANTEAAEIAADVLSAGINLDESVPVLGPFSILCGYWAVQRGAPPPQLDLSPLAILLRKLREILSAIDELMRIASMLPFFNHLCTRLFSNGNQNKTVFPALQEDDMFRPVAAVSSHEILRGVKFHEIALGSAVKGFRGYSDLLKRCLNDEKSGELKYEQHASDLSYKHMRAFALRISQEVQYEVASWHTNADGDALAKVVAIAIRNVRMTRLMRDLERIRGGTLSREADLPLSQVQKKDMKDGDHDVGDPLGGSELERRVHKKRRLVGSFSPTKLHGTAGATEATNAAHVISPTSNPGRGGVVVTYVAAAVAEPGGDMKLGSKGEKKFMPSRHDTPETDKLNPSGADGVATLAKGDSLRIMFRTKVLLVEQSPGKPNWAKTDAYWRDGCSSVHPRRLQ